jgi:hypothetical protein
MFNAAQTLFVPWAQAQAMGRDYKAGHAPRGGVRRPSKNVKDVDILQPDGSVESVRMTRGERKRMSRRLTIEAVRHCQVSELPAKYLSSSQRFGVALRAALAEPYKAPKPRVGRVQKVAA